MLHKLLILSANALAAFMDFGVGTAIAALVAVWYGVTLPYHLIFLGGILALLPDFDIIPAILRGVSPTFDHHQTLFHRPLLVLPLVMLVAYVLGGLMWLIIASLCVFAHYVHDTNFSAPTYGIAWLWPFSTQYWSSFGSYPPHPDMEHHLWLQKYWLRPSFLSIREISMGVIGISSAVWLLTNNLFLVLLLNTMIVAGVVGLWTLARNIRW